MTIKGYKIGGTMAITTGLDKSLSRSVASFFVKAARSLLKPDGIYTDDFIMLFQDSVEAVADLCFKKYSRMAVISLKSKYDENDKHLTYQIINVLNNDIVCLFEPV